MKGNIFYLMFLMLAIAFSCQNEINLQVNDTNSDEQLEKDAFYNNELIPGVGNVFYEANLKPNTSTQQILRISYHGDTISYFGRVNEAGKLEYLHTTVVEKKNNSALFIRQTYPNEGLNRMFTVENDMRSRFVIETRSFGAGKRQITLLDYNWKDGTSTVIYSSTFVDGKEVSSYSVERKLDVAECELPASTDAFDSVLDRGMAYIACSAGMLEEEGIAQYNKVVAGGKKAWDKISGPGNNNAEIETLNNAIQEQASFEQEAQQKIAEVKKSKTALRSAVDKVGEWYDKIFNSDDTRLILVPLASGTDLDYDESTDDLILLSFVLLDKDTEKAYTIEQVSFSLRFVDPVSNTIIEEYNTFSNRGDGRVVFPIDPYDFLSENGSPYSKLNAQYSFTKDSWKTYETVAVSIKHDFVQLVDDKNRPISTIVDFVEDEAKLFKLIYASQNTPIRGNSYHFLKKISTSTPVITAETEVAPNGVNIKLKSTDRSKPLQNVTFPVYYKSRKIANISARLALNIPSKVEILDGNNQQGQTGTKLAKPLRIKVTNVNGGAVGKVPVEWTITSGAGTFEDKMTETNIEGIAEANWVLGDKDLTQEVTVRVKSGTGADLEGSPLKLNAGVSSGIKLEIVSKNALGGYTNPLRVKVTNANGKAVANTEVVWHIGSPNSANSSRILNLFTNEQGISETKISWADGVQFPSKVVLKSDESISVAFPYSRAIDGIRYPGERVHSYIPHDGGSKYPNPFFIFFVNDNLEPVPGIIMHIKIAGGVEQLQTFTNGLGAIEIKWKDPNARTFGVEMIYGSKVVGSWNSVSLGQ